MALKPSAGVFCAECGSFIEYSTIARGARFSCATCGCVLTYSDAFKATGASLSMIISILIGWWLTKSILPTIGLAIVLFLPLAILINAPLLSHFPPKLKVLEPGPSPSDKPAT